VTQADLVDRVGAAIRAGDLALADARIAEAAAAAPYDPLLSSLKVTAARYRRSRSEVREIVDGALSRWFDGAVTRDAGPGETRVKRNARLADIADHGTALHYIDPVKQVMTDLPDQPSAHPGFVGLEDAIMVPRAEWSPMTADGALLVHGMGLNPRLAARALGGATPTLEETVSFHPDQRVIVIGTNENWYHFVIDYLPRLLAVLECGLLDAGWRVALGRDAADLFPQVLDLLHVPAEKVLWLDAAKAHHFPRAVYMSNMGLRGIPHQFTLSLLRRYFLPKVIDTSRPPTEPKRLFVSRTDTAWRRLRDEERLHGALQERGFEIIHPARMSLVQQVEAFHPASLVAGVHGSGLVNIVWSARPPMVIEISPFTDRDTHFSNLARRLGGRHWRLRAGPEETAQSGANKSDFSIDLAKVTDFIDEVIAETQV
jgi:hypothetical protein